MYTVRDKDLEALQAYKQLQSLDLSQCRALTDLTGLQRLPKLQSLELNCCRGLKGAALRALVQLPELRKLDLSGCSGLTDDCMPCITGRDAVPCSQEALKSPGSGTRQRLRDFGRPLSPRRLNKLPSTQLALSSCCKLPCNVQLSKSS